jgi:hypothetical protein
MCGIALDGALSVQGSAWRGIPSLRDPVLLAHLPLRVPIGRQILGQQCHDLLQLKLASQVR